MPGSGGREAGPLVLDHVDPPGLKLVVETAGRRGKGSHVTQVGQVNARGDQSAAVSQDAEAHHAQGAAGVSHELEELIPDSLTEAQSAEGKGNDRWRKGSGAPSGSAERAWS